MEENKGPYKKSRVGRFQVSLFKANRFISPLSDYGAEIPFVQVRACIQYSRFNHWNHQWERCSIWCSPEELRDLVNAVSGLTSFDE